MLTICLVAAVFVSACPGDAVVHPANSVNKGALEQYSSYLNTLSGCPIVVRIREARKYYFDHFSKSTQSDKDAAFVRYRAYYLDTIRRFNLGSFPVLAGSETLLPSPEDLKDCGMRILGSEGLLYLDETPEFLLETFGGHVSRSLRAFLKMKKDELSTISYSTVRNSATFLDVAKRCLGWEAYIGTYQKSLLMNEAMQCYEVYLSALLTGTVYTPVLGVGDVGRSAEERRKNLSVYEYVIKKEPKSRTARVVSEYIPVLKANDFSDTPALRAFCEKNELEFMYGYYTALGD